ncbi:MAG: ABC transporter permease [Anaerolineae bacterium]|nr:MAG: ABC transporter permease [Anaerolineae bacterium]
MAMYLRLAWRNIWRHRQRTVIIALAIGLGVALLMLYDGILVGFEEAVYGNAIRLLGGNVQIHAEGYSEDVDHNSLLPLPDTEAALQIARAQPGVVTASPRVQGGGIVTTREGSLPVSIVAVDPPQEARFSIVADHVVEGRYLNPDDGDVVLIGRGLADALDIRLGDRVTLSATALHEQRRTRTMTVIGIYDVGLPAFEKRTLYISISEAMSLLDLPEATEIVLVTEQVGREDALVRSLAASLPAGYEVQSWQESFPEMKQTLQLKNAVMGAFGVVILSIAAIGILNVLLMAVFERTREIGILAALGLRPGQIRAIFLSEGIMLGAVGVLVGAGIGFLLIFSLGKVGIDYSAFTELTEYTSLMSGRIYPVFVPDLFVQRIVTALVIAALAALYPAHEASRRNPAEALHYV